MLTTPTDYINHYVDILKKEYALNDLKIDYHGFIGFIMNLFGWTNFDLKQYYDYLFKEGFLATADETKNLYLHGSKNNYPIAFANAASAYGNLIFDFSKLPIRPSNVFKREVVFPDTISITVDSYVFTTKTKYKFIEEYDGSQTLYYCILQLENDRQRIVSSASPRISVPFYNFEQYEVKEYWHNVPNYSYGLYDQYTLTLSDGDQISGLDLSVKRSGSSTYETFDVKYIKAFETSISKAIFLNRISESIITLESGNGYHGEWIPNATLQISAKITKGTLGNSLKTQSGVYKSSARINYYDVSNTVLSSSTLSFGASSSTLTVDFHSSEGGEDILAGIDLRNDIISWIESRENLINKTDFYNLFSNFNKDFSILFKKSQVIDNNFYLCKALRDQYQNLLYTTNHTYKCIKYDDVGLVEDLESDIQYNVLSTLTIGRYYYKIVAIDKFYTSVPTDVILQEIDSTDRSIVLTWKVVENAESYRVYGRNNQYNQYWVVSKDQLTTDDLVYFEDIGQTGISDSCYNSYSVNEQVNYPQFDLDLEETIDINDGTYSWSLYESIDYTYYINNKTFWIDPTKIVYDSNELTKITTPRLDQLIQNSWVIIDKVLYLKLDNSFSSYSTVILHYRKDLTLTSPFIYKYSRFFDWFEGYYLQDNLIQYPIVNDIVTGYTPPVFYFNLLYNYTTDTTNVYIKSYQEISTLSFKIQVENFDTAYVDLTYDSENDYFLHSFTGFISSDSTISVEGYESSIRKFTAVTPSFQQVYYIRDQVVLLKYFDEDDNKYICNIPVLSFDRDNISAIQYENRDYVYSQIFDFVANSGLDRNRMQSDSIQTRFLNTIYCDKYLVPKLLEQTYDHHVILPLKISIKIKYNTSNIDFTTHQSDIELLVANYLQESCTGINIKFYNSKLIDLIHSYSDSITSVTVNVYDSYGTPMDNGIETKEQTDFLSLVDIKLEIVKYTDIYWWWDLDSINIELMN